MCILPENQQQEQIMIQKIDQKADLIQKLKGICERSIKEKSEELKSYCNLMGRAIFYDLANTKNYKEIFKFQLIATVLWDCRDRCVVQADSPYEFLEYHIDDYEFNKLYDLIKESKIGKEGINIKRTEPVAKCPRIMKAIYDLLAIDPSFPEPEFTNFDRVPKDIPIRLADGKPNPEFFKTWFENAKKFFER